MSEEQDRIEAFRKAGWVMIKRTPGKRWVIDAEGRYREVGEEIPIGQAIIDGVGFFLWADGSRTPWEEI